MQDLIDIFSESIASVNWGELIIGGILFAALSGLILFYFQQPGNSVNKFLQSNAEIEVKSEAVPVGESQPILVRITNLRSHDQDVEDAWLYRLPFKNESDSDEENSEFRFPYDNMSHYVEVQKRLAEADNLPASEAVFREFRFPIPEAGTYNATLKAQISGENVSDEFRLRVINKSDTK